MLARSWLFASGVVLFVTLGLLAPLVSANECYGKDIGDGDCCGREGDTIYWCQSGEKCDGLTQCKPDNGNPIGFWLGAVFVGAIVVGACFCCRRWSRRRAEAQQYRQHNALLAAQQQQAAATPAVVVGVAGAPPPANPTYNQPEQQPQPAVEPCPYAPASDVYGYDHQPQPPTANNKV